MTFTLKPRQSLNENRLRQGPRLLTVIKAWRVTPNMVRVVFSGPELEGFPEGREGGNCKLLLPEPGETRQDFANRLSSGQSLVKRTYTVRDYNTSTNELVIDFVAHGDEGPASSWACHAKAGDFLGFAGPSMPKVTYFEADWYLFAADLSGLPVCAAALEAMPRDAKGIAIFEVPSLADKQEIDAPSDVEIYWIEQNNLHKPSSVQEDFIRALDWPERRVQTCIAGEAGVISGLRSFLIKEKQLPRDDAYISGYWKIGLIEDEHQQMKRQQQ